VGGKHFQRETFELAFAFTGVQGGNEKLLLMGTNTQVKTHKEWKSKGASNWKELTDATTVIRVQWEVHRATDRRAPHWRPVVAALREREREAVRLANFETSPTWKNDVEVSNPSRKRVSKRKREEQAGLAEETEDQKNEEGLQRSVSCAKPSWSLERTVENSQLETENVKATEAANVDEDGDGENKNEATVSEGHVQWIHGWKFENGPRVEAPKLHDSAQIPSVDVSGMEVKTMEVKTMDEDAAVEAAPPLRADAQEVLDDGEEIGEKVREEEKAGDKGAGDDVAMCQENAEEIEGEEAAKVQTSADGELQGEAEKYEESVESGKSSTENMACNNSGALEPTFPIPQEFATLIQRFGTLEGDKAQLSKDNARLSEQVRTQQMQVEAVVKSWEERVQQERTQHAQDSAAQAAAHSRALVAQEASQIEEKARAIEAAKKQWRKRLQQQKEQNAVDVAAQQMTHTQASQHQAVVHAQALAAQAAEHEETLVHVHAEHARALATQKSRILRALAGTEAGYDAGLASEAPENTDAAVGPG
jgi:hypothetical protein